MDLLALVKLIVKRWYVVVPVLAAAVAIAVWLQSDVEREYQAQGSLILTPPEFDPARAPSVPTVMASAVQELRTSQGAQAIVEAGGSDDFTLARLDGLQVQVSVPGDGADAALTAELVMESIARSVTDRQVEADIPEDEQVQWTSNIGMQGIETPEDADPDETADPVTVGLLTFEDPAANRANPFAAGETTSRLLQYAIQSDAGQSDVFERVGHPDFRGFSVTPERGPGIIIVSTTAGDSTVAIESFDAVQSALEAELDSRQDRADVAMSRRLTIEAIAAPAVAADVTPPVNRGAAVIVALGGLLAVALVIVVENVVYRVRLRRSRRAAPQATEVEAAPSGLQSEQTLGSR